MPISEQWTKRKLGRTGMEVTPIGLGGAWLGYVGGKFDEGLATATAGTALELGVNLIDTSACYQAGRSEVAIGAALEKWCSQGGRREDVIVSTKTGTRTHPSDYSAEATKRSVSESLQALKTEYLDILMVHDPESLQPVLAPHGAWRELIRMKEAGAVRAIGLGVRNNHLLHRIVETGQCDVILTYRDYHLLSRGAAGLVLPAASWRGVGVLNGMALMKGLLSGDDPRKAAEKMAASSADRPFGPAGGELARATELWQWCQDKGTSLLALALQYCMREARIASTLVGASTPEQIEADVKAATQPIPQDIWRQIKHRFGI